MPAGKIVQFRDAANGINPKTEKERTTENPKAKLAKKPTVVTKMISQLTRAELHAHLFGSGLS